MNYKKHHSLTMMFFYFHTNLESSTNHWNSQPKIMVKTHWLNYHMVLYHQHHLIYKSYLLGCASISHCHSISSIHIVVIKIHLLLDQHYQMEKCNSNHLIFVQLVFLQSIFLNFLKVCS